METRAIDVATALLVATAALCCSVVVGCAYLLAVAAADAKVLPRGDEWSAWLAAAALACASVAALMALTRDAGGLRPGALAMAWALAFAWPLSGFPLPAALMATLATGVAVAWGARGASARPGALTAILLAVLAIELMTVAFLAAPGERAAYGAPPEVRATTRDDAPAAGDENAPGPAERPAPSVDERAPGPAERPSSPAGGHPSSPAAEPAPSPARVVRSYYRALDRRDFRGAWRSLSPSVRTSFGGIERWSGGFAATLASAPSDLRVTVSRDDASVSHVLTARDRAGCGTLVRRFSVQWRMHRTGSAWRATALSAQPLGAAGCA